MAVSKKGMLGDLTGTVGNINFYQDKGKTIARSRRSIKNITQSEALAANKLRFKKLHALMQAIYPFIRLGFNDAAGQNRVPFRMALSSNLVASRTASDAPDLHWLKISEGTRAGALQPALQLEDQKAIITWGDPDSGAPCNDNDQAIIMAINTTTFKTNMFSKTPRRGHHLAVIDLPQRSGQEQMMVFLFFYLATDFPTANNLRNVSRSQCIGIC
jgi:hypothetical protein